MINMAFMPLYMWEMWDVTPVTDGRTHGRTVESCAVFSLSWIRNYWNYITKSYYIVASSFSLNQMWGHILAYLWAYLMETRDVCFWIFDILDEEGQDYLLGIVCFPSECFHYIPGSLPEGIYKVATQTNCFPCPNSPTIIRLPFVSFMLC